MPPGTSGCWPSPQEGIGFRQYAGLYSVCEAYSASCRVAQENQIVFNSGVLFLFLPMEGMQLSLASLITGISSAKGFLALLQSVQHRRVKRGLPKLQTPVAEDLVRRWKSFWLFVALAAGMWIAALLLSLVHISHVVRRRLWLACAVAPPGVWTRWYLARLNGRGLGSKHRLKWLPVGTLLANLIASLLESGLSTVQLAVRVPLSLAGSGRFVRDTFVLSPVHLHHRVDLPGERRARNRAYWGPAARTLGMHEHCVHFCFGSPHDASIRQKLES